MNIFNTTLRAIAKRPLIILIPAILLLLCSLINTYNPIIPFISGIASITGGTAFDSLISALQMLLNPSFLPVILAAFIAIALLASLFTGIILSGYFNIVASAVEGREKERSEFIEGLRHYFSKVFLISLRAVPFMLFLAVFMLIASLPAIIVTKSTLSDKPELLIAAVFIDILTIAVMLFGFLFSSAYIFFWYPSALKTVKKTFTYAKRLVDRHFWGIILRILLFYIAFAAVHYLISATGRTMVQQLLLWLFDTAFLTTLSVYVFDAFKTYSNPSNAQ